LAPGDRIHQIDGISTIGLTNQHIYSVLCHGEGQAVIEIEYSLPEYSELLKCWTSEAFGFEHCVFFQFHRAVYASRQSWRKSQLRGRTAAWG
jgi:uncharacterized protein Usg